jgi:hypothetical protein
MIVIILAVYKSCTKYREYEPRQDLSNMYANGNSTLPGFDYPSGSATATAFPPPPPPYGFVNSNGQASSAGSYKPEYAHMHPTSTTTASGTFPDSASSGANPSQNNNSSNRIWSSFLTGAAVGGLTGYLLNRRR